MQESCEEKDKKLGEKNGAEPIVKRRKTGGKIAWPFMDRAGPYINTSLPGLGNSDDFACRYYLRHFLRKGAYGSVYVGETRLGSPVAVKIMHNNVGDLSGREVVLHKHCSDHPNVIDVIDGFVSAFYVVLVMPLASATLHHHITKTTVTLEDAQRLVEQIASGLAHVHAKHIIHCDLPSGNILVCASAGSLHSAQLTDFGLACKFNAALGNEPAMSITVVGGV